MKIAITYQRINSTVFRGCNTVFIICGCRCRAVAFAPRSATAVMDTRGQCLLSATVDEKASASTYTCLGQSSMLYHCVSADKPKETRLRPAPRTWRSPTKAGAASVQQRRRRWGLGASPISIDGASSPTGHSAAARSLANNQSCAD